MLFPTIERMAETPQGKVMTPVLCQLRYLFYLPLFLLSLLPENLRSLLSRLVLRGVPGLDPAAVRPTVELLSGDSAGGWTPPGRTRTRTSRKYSSAEPGQNLDLVTFS